MTALAWLGAAQTLVLVAGLGLLWGAGPHGDAPLSSRRLRNLALFAATTATLALLSPLFAPAARPAPWAGPLARAPLGAGARLAAGVLLADLGHYVQHIACHRLGWLWRLHRVHHSDARVDVTTSLRDHPLLAAASLAWRALWALALGIDPMALALWALSMTGWSLAQHAGLSLSPGVERVLRWALVTPSLHRAHHGRDGARGDNAGAIFSFWDRAFGTLEVGPPSGPAEPGLRGYDGERWQSLAGLLWRTPFGGEPESEARTQEGRAGIDLG